MSDEAGYWNDYYSTPGTRLVLSHPSQFAVFFAGEIGDSKNVVDLGCGNGRDSLFFASRGLNVLGLDSSATAIEECSAQAKNQGLSNANFGVANLGKPGVIEALDLPMNPLFYARFFMHALDQGQQEAVLAGVRERIGTGTFGLEFRTSRDRVQPKVTETHYRRFIDPMEFAANAISFGFRVDYFVQGFGYAKFGSDDAHVARFVMSLAPE